MKYPALFAAIAAVYVAVPMRADVTVTNITVRQHWPWNGLVDIDYEIVSDTPDASYWVYPKATDNRLGRGVVMNTLSGDGATNSVGVGTYRMVWDAKADNPGFHTTDLSVTIQAVADAARYLVVDLSGGPDAVTYPVRYSTEPPDLNDDTCRTTELWLRLILPGTFVMGSPTTSVGRRGDETQHTVTLTKPYYLGVFEITQKQYELVTGSAVAQSDSSYGPDRARGGITYDAIRGSSKGRGWPQSNAVDDTSFIGKMRSKTQLLWDLPTEAQWEFACRAGTTTDVNTGANIANASGSDAAMNAAGVDPLSRVGTRTPNAWGLYDTHGNVCEWCLDWYANYPVTAVTDPQGWVNGSRRVIRGGAHISSAYNCASSRRFFGDVWSANFYYGSYSSSPVGFRAAVLPFD